LRSMPQVRALDCLQSNINELVFNEFNQFIKNNS
jgi:hypothetical protein